MGKATPGQALSVVASVCTDTRWDEIDGDLLQRRLIELTPRERGEMFTAFLKQAINQVTEDELAVKAKFYWFEAGIMVSELTELFIARDHFKPCRQSIIYGKYQTAEPWIFVIRPDFEKHFLGVHKEHLVFPRLQCLLGYARLSENATVGSVLNELGDQADTDVAAVFDVLKKQDKGEIGILNHGSTGGNIFFVRNDKGKRLIVKVGHINAGWVLDADAVLPSEKLCKGDMIFYTKAKK